MDVSFSGILSYLEEKADKLISTGEYTKVEIFKDILKFISIEYRSISRPTNSLHESIGIDI